MDYEMRRAEARQEDEDLEQALKDLGSEMEVSPEWKLVLALLRGSWPGSVSKSEALSYLTVLSDLDPRTIAKAVRDLARQGTRYRPTPGEIRSQAIPESPEDLPITFDEAWSLILEAGRGTGFDEDRALDRLRQSSRITAAWAQTRGLRTLWHLPSEDPEAGRFVLRDLAGSWQAFSEAWKSPSRRPSLEAPRGSGRLRRLENGPDRPSLEEG